MARKVFNGAFGNGETYVRLTLQEFERRAASDKFTQVERVEPAALAFAGKDGHAQFSKGELARILGQHFDDGTFEPVTGPRVSRAIAAAKNRGTLAPESRAHCLVVPAGFASQGLGKSGCVVHGTHR